MENFIFRYFWIAFILVTIINGFIFRSRAKHYINRDPTLAVGYNSLIKGWMIYGNIPWLIMGFGVLSGITNSIFEFFFPGLMNPVVLLFHASILALWGLSIRWLYFKGGAEMLERHPGFLNRTMTGRNYTAIQIKQFFPFVLLGGIAGMVIMWIMSFTHQSIL